MTKSGQPRNGKGPVVEAASDGLIQDILPSEMWALGGNYWKGDKAEGERGLMGGLEREDKRVKWLARRHPHSVV